MINISKQQKMDRWDNLPDNLKQALFSEQNSTILWRICENQHLPADRISAIAVVTGYVILGFIHAEDLAKEIKDELGINQEIANVIALEIDRKIFGPIRNDLEKVYSMPVEEKETEAETLDLRKKTAEQRLGEVVAPASGAGISGKTEVKPVIEEPVSAGTEKPKIVSAEEKPVQIEKGKEGLPAEAPAEAGPMIIHKEAEFKPLSADKKSLGGLFGFLKKDKERKPEAVSAAKAQIELGNQPLTGQGLESEQQPAEMKSPKVAKTEIPKVRVVHYSDVPMPTSPFPGEGAGRPESEAVIERHEPLKDEKAIEKDKGIEIKPPENLPTGPSVVKTPSQRVNPPQKEEVKPLQKQPDKVFSGQTLNLRKPQAESKSEFEKSTPGKPVSEGKTPAPTEKEAGEESEMIDLTTFKKI